MLLNYPGESHGRGLPYGLELLEIDDGNFAVNIGWTGTHEAYTDQHLRVSKAHWSGTGWPQYGGEEDTWTHPGAITRMNDHFSYAESLGTPIDAFAFGWCWDMTAGGCDGNGWAGRAYTDFAKTVYTGHWDIGSTSPNLNDYIAAWEGYEANHPGTTMIYTTGPVDGATGCEGYQRWLKNNAIRDHVANNGGYLFDYAGILTHNNAGSQATVQWTDTTGIWGTPGAAYSLSTIHPDNSGDYNGGQGGCHVGEAGVRRLAKAMWVMLAMIAGWDGTSGLTYGDVSGNGTISSSDAALVARYVVDLETFTEEQKTQADVSGNGSISSTDAALIAQRAVGLIDVFPVENQP